MATAKIVIKGDNQLKAPLKQAQQDITGFEKVAAQVGNTLKKAFTVGAIVVSIKKLKDAAADCLNEFNEADRAYKQLSLALNDTKGFDTLTKSIKELSRQTLSSKDDIEGMVSELAALGKSTEEIDSISRAAVYLSNVTGKDLNSSMQTLLNTYNGTTKQLNKLGIDTSELTKEELKEGAAVQLVIDKFQDLSKEMAKNDTAQRIKNIKDSIGDIKQSVGDLVNTLIGPTIQKIDEGLLTIKEKFNGFIQEAKVVIQNFPEVLSHLFDAIKKGLSNLFSYEGIKTFLSNVLQYIKSAITTTLTNIANLATGIYGLVERLWDGIKNYSMYIITSICDDIGLNISEVINSIGEWLTGTALGKAIDQIISKVVNGIRLIGNIIKNIPSIVKIVISNIGTIIASLFNNLPKAIGQIFVGLGNKVAEFALKIKNDIAQAIEDTINGIGEKISDTWLGKWLGLGKGMKDFSIGVDRTSEREAGARANNAFGNAGSFLSNIGDDLEPMMKEIESLLNPVFTKWTADNATTIGQTMAKWSAKSTDEYYKAAKESFTDIGSFLKDWGATFVGDMKDGWGETADALATIFEDSFGGSFDEFLEWFRPFMEEKLADTGSSGGSGTNKTKEGSSDLSTVFNAVVSEFSSQMGEAGELIGKLAQNMSSMGPLIGAIVTAIHYVVGGLSETLGPILNEFVEWGIKPLTQLGKMLGQILVPVFEEIMPSIITTGKTLIALFKSLTNVLSPIIKLISKVLGPILNALATVLMYIVGTISWACEWIAYAITWVLNKITFGWVSTSSKPGSLGSYINNMTADIPSGTDATTDSSSSSTAVSNASYSGGTVVHLNVYQNGTVVGQNGIMEFALMIRDKLVESNYLGR